MYMFKKNKQKSIIVIYLFYKLPASSFFTKYRVVLMDKVVQSFICKKKNEKHCKVRTKNTDDFQHSFLARGA